MKRWWQWSILSVILLVAVVSRCLYLHENVGTPDFSHLAVDAAFHHHWAKGLATGDWSVPQAYEDPQIRSTAYLRPPGYPMFLAGVYAIFGVNDMAPRIVQMALGVVSCVLAFVLARRWFSAAAGLTTAGLMAGYWLFPYFESKLHAPSLLIVLGLGTLYAMSLWAQRVSVWRVVVAGLLVGCFALVRPTILPFGLVATVWLLWVMRRRQETASRWAKAVLGYGVGVLVVIAPATIRNAIVSGQFVLISSNAGVNLYIGNNEASTGCFINYFPGLGDFGTCFDYPAITRAVSRRVGKPMRDAEISRYFASLAMQYMREHPGRTIGMMIRKASLFWGPQEISHNEFPSYDRARSRVLTLLWGKFTWVTALSLAGLALLIWDLAARRRGSDAVPDACHRQLEVTVLIVAFIVVSAATFLPFFFASLYRVPLIPPLLLLAAVGLCLCANDVRLRAWTRVACWLVVVGGGYAVASVNRGSYTPDPTRWRYHRGVVYDFANQPDMAAVQYRKALELTPTHTLANYNLGVILQRQGLTDQAIERYGQALRSNPEHVGARVNLAIALAEGQRFDDAIAHYRAVLAIQPNDVSTHNNLAIALDRVGKTDEAIEHYRTAMRLAPTDVEVQCNLAITLAAHNQADEAISLFRAILDAVPNDVRTHERLANALLARNVLGEAAEHYGAVLALEPGNAGAHNGLGLIHAMKGQWPDAIKRYREALLTEPNDPRIRANLGDALVATGQLDDALTHYTESLRHDPTSGETHYRYGEALGKLGRAEQAIEQYTEAVTLDPNHADAHNNLGLLLAGKGDLAAAAAHYHRAIDVKPDHALAHYNLAGVLAAGGHDREALGHYERTAALMPNHPVVLDGLAWLLATSADPTVRDGSRAITLATQACELTDHRDAKLLDTLAAAYAEIGRFDQAITAAQTAMRLAQQSGDQHLAQAVGQQLLLYQRGEPFHQPAR